MHRPLLLLERHAQGPRLYALGRRLHEWHLGLALVSGGLALRLAGLSSWAALAAGAGAYLAAKDWRDLFPRLRDTSAWALGGHRRFAPLRPFRSADGLPAVAAAVAFAVAVVNLLSALTPNVAWRGQLLLQVEPVEAVPLLHAAAVPTSVALVVAAFHLKRRRRRAWQAAVVLLVALGALDLLKGFDVEEALLSFGAAGLLWWGKPAFYVRHGPLNPRAALGWLAAGGAAALVPAGVLVWLGSGRQASLPAVVRETVDLFAWTNGPLAFGDEFAWLPLALGLGGVLAVLAAAAPLFRPLAPPRCAPDPGVRQAALELVRAHGSDTLAFFKLRRDVQYLFARDRRAFLAYRVAGNVMLVSGDPVGPPDSLPALVREACAFTERHGLRIAALGTSSALVPLWRDAGLRSLYIGDEAILDAPAFSLEGRAIRKVRQSVQRLERLGYRAELRELRELGPEALAELERVSTAWRSGAPERGFAMALDSLGGTDQADSILVAARDPHGAVRGFLHLVPSYGRPAVSLSFMRREPATPNGLTEFLVARSVELLRARGIEEISLNFAAFGRLLERPRTRAERVLSRVIALGNPFFQLESLLRFNAKFFPRWEPRYLMYEGAFGLARAGIAALRVEGQLPALRSG